MCGEDMLKFTRVRSSENVCHTEYNTFNIIIIDKRRESHEPHPSMSFILWVIPTETPSERFCEMTGSRFVLPVMVAVGRETQDGRNDVKMASNNAFSRDQPD